ncbi:MAG: DnaB-like helicase C-terminal domain-containing protein [Chitinophagaceae bacterium]|nr:DnaB-like helicase C-terminal domain-containing protein [Chitinophagaceae bacterium]
MTPGIKKRIENLIENPSLSEVELILHLRQLLLNNELFAKEIGESVPISTLVAENIQRLEKGEQGRDIITTGFKDFDENYSGLARGELVVLGGRPAMGKTQLMVNLALNIADRAPVLYFTFDLSDTLLAQRFISCLSGIPVNQILDGSYPEDAAKSLRDVLKEFQDKKIFINNTCNYSVQALKNECRKQAEENGVEVIIVDYLQMMSTNRYRHNREIEIGYITRELKNIARDLNVCVIALSQLSRAAEYRTQTGQRPIPSDLRDSGAIEQDADKVLLLYRPEYYGYALDEFGNDTERKVEIIFAKNRNGKAGKVILKADEEFTCFYDYKEEKRDLFVIQKRLDELDNPFE